LFHGYPQPLRPHHQGGLATGLDRGVAGPCLQCGAQDVDFDVLAIDATGLAATPQIGLADEVRDEHGGGAVIYLGRSADLLDIALIHHRNAVAHGERFFLVVGDVDEGDADLALNPFELELHDLTKFQVECPEGFVEKQGAGIVDQCPCQCDALLLPAGQLGGPALGEIGEADDLEHFVDTSSDLVFSRGALVDLLVPWPVGDVVPYRHVGEQRVMLKDGVDVALMRSHPGDVDSLEADGAIRGGFESRDHS